MKTFHILLFIVLGFINISAQDSLTVTRLPNVVNTNQDEIHPIPFGEDILYYSSNFREANKIYRTEKMSSEWKEPLQPVVFENTEKKHFQGGSFTPNKARFYFSQCDMVNGEYLCKIYVMQRSGQSWSKPKKLPEYINKEGYTTSDACVHVVDGEEILYFSSDRKGGRGGRDIWFAIKKSDTKDLEFEEPVNLGKIVNTQGDEISPFYDRSENTLYFSSNGQKKNLGNLDIYTIIGEKTVWEKPILLKSPVNSKYDDAYFRLADQTLSGFFSSNRSNTKRVANQKDYDIYHLKNYRIIKNLPLQKKRQVKVEGKILNKENISKKITDIRVELCLGQGMEQLQQYMFADSGNYSFIVDADKTYFIKLKRGDTYIAKRKFTLTEKDTSKIVNIDFLVYSLLYEIELKKREFKLTGVIHDALKTDVLLDDVNIIVSELTSDDRLIFEREGFFSKNYSIELNSTKNYKISLSRNGYTSISFLVLGSSIAENKNWAKMDFYMFPN